MGQNNLKASIDVDIGGTFTDALIKWNEKTVFTKTPTTNYNLSVGFIKAIREAATRLETDVPTLLQNTDLIRYSTTIAMNKLLEKKGPRLGLITTSGFEDTIFVGKGAQWADGLPVRERRNVARAQRPEPLIPRDLTVGVHERIDSNGVVVGPLIESDVIDKLTYLVDQGVRGIVVSLLWSYLNPIHERRIREIMRTLYPDCYLGNIPIFLSSEVLPKRFEYTRTITTVLNAYLHQAMWEELLGMSEELRKQNFKRSLMMVHNSGGMAEVYKTSAVQTYNGGPVAGLLGAAHLGKQMDIQDLIVADMGGTSFDLSIVEKGSPRSSISQPLIDRWQVGIAMLETRSIGAGGGSIAWLNDTAGLQVEVGPRSAGSMPGPAAYDQGGNAPTVTDADVVLGYLNPDYFHGGQLQLNPDRARTVIQKEIARPLGLTVEQAAILIRRVIDAKMGYTLFKETALRGYDSRLLPLFAGGGAGPTHCVGIAQYAHISRILTFPFSPVFCAFGSANMDVRHVYELSSRVQILAPGGKEWLQEYDAFNHIVSDLKDKALRDIKGEGLPVQDVMFELELDMMFGGQLNIKRTSSPCLELKKHEDIQALYHSFVEAYSKAYSPVSVFPAGGVIIHNFILHAILRKTRLNLPAYPLQNETPSLSALKQPRPVFWKEYPDFVETAIYEEEKLQPGNVIHGPAIVEAPNTTTVIPPAWRYSVNKFRIGVIEKQESFGEREV
ncbi:hydantoinase/oxoprolinase family protein [candidate division CSSED10-310 bacterium]|uniref:Hydantoinase/oxoprolinase family protein n=1 Tax=candidate division CSSED10-310 bacterium TaxID=2855610 RepID=A0ABV6YSQ6_UNCC1